MCSTFRWLNISKVYLLEAKKGKKYQPSSTYSWHGKLPLLQKAVILSYNNSPELIYLFLAGLLFLFSINR